MFDDLNQQYRELIVEVLQHSLDYHGGPLREMVVALLEKMGEPTGEDDP